MLGSMVIYHGRIRKNSPQTNISQWIHPWIDWNPGSVFVLLKSYWSIVYTVNGRNSPPSATHETQWIRNNNWSWILLMVQTDRVSNDKKSAKRRKQIGQHRKCCTTWQIAGNDRFDTFLPQIPCSNFQICHKSKWIFDKFIWKFSRILPQKKGHIKPLPVVAQHMSLRIHCWHHHPHWRNSHGTSRCYTPKKNYTPGRSTHQPTKGA